MANVILKTVSHWISVNQTPIYTILSYALIPHCMNVSVSCISGSVMIWRGDRYGRLFFNISGYSCFYSTHCSALYRDEYLHFVTQQAEAGFSKSPKIDFTFTCLTACRCPATHESGGWSSDSAVYPGVSHFVFGSSLLVVNQGETRCQCALCLVSSLFSLNYLIRFQYQRSSHCDGYSLWKSP